MRAIGYTVRLPKDEMLIKNIMGGFIMNKKINTMYFSATGTTKKVVAGIAKKLAEDNDKNINHIDFTLPEVRKAAVAFTEEDVVIIGVPVYAGRVPNILLKYLNSITGNGALAIAIVVYGNRNYDDALIELRDILAGNGFQVIAGGPLLGNIHFLKLLQKIGLMNKIWRSSVSLSIK